MNDNSLTPHYEQIIDQLVDKLRSAIDDNTITIYDVRQALESVARTALQEGETLALSNILSTKEVAEILGVSIRRVRALAKSRHEEYGVGFQIPGSSQWLFRLSEIDILRPGLSGRPKNE